MPYYALLALLAVITILFSSVKIVKQQTAFTIETLGKFSRVIYPGLNLVIPFIENTGRKINLSTMTLDCPILAITSDKVNIKIDTSLIYKVIPTLVYQAAYSLDTPIITIRSLIDNTIRAFVATLTHEEVIRSRDEMTHYLIENLTGKMQEFGYEIDSFQFRDIVLPVEIMEAMSRVVSSKRLQEAAHNEAEADYIRRVREAEAQRQTRLLQGQGIALERKAIIEGLSESVKELRMATGVTSESVMGMVMLNQYIDMLRVIGSKDGSKTVFINPTPNGMNEIMQQASELINK